MRNLSRKIYLLISLLLVISLSAAWYIRHDLPLKAELSATAEFQWVDCWLPVDTFRTVHCAWLTPEQGVKLPVAIIRRSVFPVKFKPLLYINGGPGAATISAYGGLTGWVEWLERLDIDRDLVLIDFAGTGYSQPGFSCPSIPGIVSEMLLENITAEESAQRYYAALQACRSKLGKNGTDLSVLTLPRMVKHVKKLLGIAAGTDWDLYGVSYGTRIILNLLRDPPGNTGNIVLDSVYPPDVSGNMTIARLYADALDRLFSACRSVNECANHYPDLERKFYDFLGQLDKQPLRITHESAVTGEEVTTILNGYRMIDMLFISMYSWDFIEVMPMALWGAMHGDMTALVPLVESYHYFQVDEGFSDMVFTSSTCSEMHKDETHEKILKTWDAYSAIASHMKGLWSVDICKDWPVTPVDNIYSQPVYSELPVLLFSGSFDPITPPEHARKAMQGLPNATLQVFYGMGHDLLDSDDCALNAFRDYLSDGSLDRDYADLCNGINDVPEFRFMRNWY